MEIDKFYVEVTNNLMQRNNFVKASEIKNYIKPNTEAYRSYFLMDEAMVNNIIEGKEINKNSRGKFYLKTIILDVDKGENDFDTMMNKVRNLAERLNDEFNLLNQYQIYFSGRGFHFHLPDIFRFEPSKYLPDIVRETIITHFPEADPKPINKRGLIRLQGSMNLKTSLYKIPIRESEIWFLNEGDLIKWASNNRKIEIVKPKGWKTYPELIKMPKRDINGVNKALKTFQGNPSRYVTCCVKMYNAGAFKGKRHERVLRISSWLRLRGLPLKATLDVVKGYIGENEWSGEWVKIVNDVYSKEYSYSCEDPVMKEFCSPKCVFYKRKNWLTEIQSATEIENELIKHYQTDWKKNSINLAPILGMKFDEWYIQPEDVVGLIGATGTNKTALLQNVAIQLKDFSPILYISTEFSNRLLIRRFSQIAHNLSKEEVIDHYQNYKKGDAVLSDAFSHIKFVSATPTFEGLEDLIRKYKPRVLMIDVIDDIISNGKRGTEGESIVGKGIKDLGRKYNHFTFYVHHISKSAAYDEKGNPKRLNLHSGKGSSTIDQKSDIVLGIEGYQNKDFRLIRSLKFRDNPPFQYGYNVNMDTFRFSRNMDVNEIIIPRGKAKLSK